MRTVPPWYLVDSRCVAYSENVSNKVCDRFGLTSPIKRQWIVEYGHSLNRISIQTVRDRIASAHAQDPLSSPSPHFMCRGLEPRAKSGLPGSRRTDHPNDPPPDRFFVQKRLDPLLLRQPELSSALMKWNAAPEGAGSSRVLEATRNIAHLRDSSLLQRQTGVEHSRRSSLTQ